MTDDATQGLDLQPEKPHSARFWNYLLGGKDNFEADQRLGEQLKAEWPAAVDIARASRAFLGRTVRHLAGEAGVRQFLDIGTGLPTADNTHEVAQRVAPDARIVYVDHDPIVLAHARALLTSTPEGATDYVDADLTAPDTVLAHATRTLDLERPVALMLLSTIGHVQDPIEAAQLVQTYMARLAHGSYLVLCTTLASPAVNAANETYAASGTIPYVASTADGMMAMAAGLTIPPPGLGPINRWYPEGPMDPDVDQWGYVAYKE
ncbi:SAM-dependent methyltransferase (plasmid) [Streptomyces scopuliridis]|uniref:SAM-dependent methyltransferase n=1 Tax=Streptomyces scopuliridis TaxID=452529 RepID=UPI002DDAE5FA|nr:SAM-dependent methyltransferase [Streptomyces scopuliridis]WSB39187.1 SAM-dependent methyltransferase [Streptomyces scopuliridis]